MARKNQVEENTEGQVEGQVDGQVTDVDAADLPADAKEIRTPRPSHRVRGTTILTRGPQADAIKRPKYKTIVESFPEAGTEGLTVDQGIEGAVAKFGDTLKSKHYAEDPRGYVRSYLSELITAGALEIIGDAAPAEAPVQTPEADAAAESAEGESTEA